MANSRGAALSTLGDLDELALSLPSSARELSADGRPSYRVQGKLFCCQRARRRDAVDPATGELLDDVVLIRVPDLAVKELLLADARAIFFTTPHFDGYPAILVRIPALAGIEHEELEQLIVEAWLTRAPARLARTLPERSDRSHS